MQKNWDIVHIGTGPGHLEGVYIVHMHTYGKQVGGKIQMGTQLYEHVHCI